MSFKEQITQGGFRTWPSCNSLRGFRIYWSIWEYKSCTPCRQKERQNMWRSVVVVDLSNRAKSTLPYDTKGRRPPRAGCSRLWGGRDRHKGQKLILTTEVGVKLSCAPFVIKCLVFWSYGFLLKPICASSSPASNLILFKKKKKFCGAYFYF